MQSPVGNCFTRAWNEPRSPRTFPFWSLEPDVDYFRSLAHAGIRSFYRAEHPKREQIVVNGSPKEVIAEAVRLVNQDGKEICRWTAAEEYNELAGLRH
jgi:hypothetical protein